METTTDTATTYTTTKGSRYQAGRDLAEVAKMVRADIKAAAAAGELPAELRASVKIHRYSMGQSLRVEVVACPVPADARAILATITAICEAYNRVSTSNQPDDYHNADFYLHVGFDSEIRAALRRSAAIAA